MTVDDQALSSALYFLLLWTSIFGVLTLYISYRLTKKRESQATYSPIDQDDHDPEFGLDSVADESCQVAPSSPNRKTGRTDGGGFSSAVSIPGLKYSYLCAYLLATFSDWLQGPYVYVLYDAYGFTKHENAILFIFGFGSSMVLGTFIAGYADKYGRKRFAILYCGVYILSCLAKHVNSFTMLIIGRILAGVATSLLFCVFESWIVCEVSKRGLDESVLSEILSAAIFGNGLVAIVAGFLAQLATELWSEFTLLRGPAIVNSSKLNASGQGLGALPPSGEAASEVKSKLDSNPSQSPHRTEEAKNRSANFTEKQKKSEDQSRKVDKEVDKAVSSNSKPAAQKLEKVESPEIGGQHALSWANAAISGTSAASSSSFTQRHNDTSYTVKDGLTAKVHGVRRRLSAPHDFIDQRAWEIRREIFDSEKSSDNFDFGVSNERYSIRTVFDSNPFIGNSKSLGRRLAPISMAPNDGSIYIGKFLGPFDVAIVVCIACAWFVRKRWRENYGSDDVGDIDGTTAENAQVESADNEMTVAWRIVKSEAVIRRLAILTSFFESSMFIFVFLWTPAIQESVPSAAHVPYGTIFAVFMLGCMCGSCLFTILREVWPSLGPEKLSAAIFFVAAGANLGVALSSSVLVRLSCFILFEMCLGLYFPTMGLLKSKYVPERSRSMIYSFFRVPLNLIVVLALVVDIPVVLGFYFITAMLIYCVIVSFQEFETPITRRGSPNNSNASGKKEIELGFISAETLGKQNSNWRDPSFAVPTTNWRDYQFDDRQFREHPIQTEAIGNSFDEDRKQKIGQQNEEVQNYNQSLGIQAVGGIVLPSAASGSSSRGPSNRASTGTSAYPGPAESASNNDDSDAESDMSGDPGLFLVFGANNPQKTENPENQDIRNLRKQLHGFNPPPTIALGGPNPDHFLGGLNPSDMNPGSMQPMDSDQYRDLGIGLPSHSLEHRNSYSSSNSDNDNDGGALGLFGRLDGGSISPSERSITSEAGPSQLGMLNIPGQQCFR